MLTVVLSATHNNKWPPDTDPPNPRVSSGTYLAIAEARFRAWKWAVPAEFVAADEVIFQ